MVVAHCCTPQLATAAVYAVVLRRKVPWHCVAEHQQLMKSDSMPLAVLLLLLLLSLQLPFCR
jgi:hypothetical protein